ncbi:MAG TPA: TetR/AcrR family transcriptional regulator [Puia sp.]|nr:TetR/AcrR family transcriptional regulator [Puia sp.]
MSATREHIIDLADKVIREKGFNAFPYADIAAVLEIRKAAIHYHFPSKSQLGQAVMEEELSRLDLFRRLNARVGGDLQLKHLVGTFYHNARRQVVCLMGALTPEFATFDAEMQATLRRLCLVIREWVGECLEEARVGERLRFEGPAMDRAALVVSTLLASLLLSRIEGVEIFRQMVDRMLEDLGAHWRVGDLAEADPSVDRHYSFT